MPLTLTQRGRPAVIPMALAGLIAAWIFSSSFAFSLQSFVFTTYHVPFPFSHVSRTRPCSFPPPRRVRQIKARSTFLQVSVEPPSTLLPDSPEVRDNLMNGVNEQKKINTTNGMLDKNHPAVETDEQQMKHQELAHILSYDEIYLQRLLFPSVPVSYDENGMVCADAALGITPFESIPIDEQDYPGFIKFLYRKDTNGQTLASKLFNFTLLAVSFGYVFFSVFNIDKGMTRGWSPSEIGMRIPLDTWASYENSLSEKPVATKTIINVVIYLLGDWLSQTLFQRNNVLDFDAARTIKNGFIGMCFGPAVHEYYEFSDWILPVDGVTIGITNRAFKILMDQTIYLAIKCSIYIIAIGVLNGESLETGSENVKNRIKPIMFTAWRFWPLVHCVTYGLIPARHRILWVNSVDLVWNAILATKARGDNTSAGEDDGEEDAALGTKVGDSSLV